MTAQDFKKLIKDTNARFVDLKFVDLPGTWQHFSVAVEAFGDEIFDEGIGFDGSSIRGFQHIEESDMLLIPDASSAFLDPFCDEPTISLICNIKDPISRKMYTRDPRYVAQKAERYLKESGIADTAYFGPELEFYIFDDVRYDQTVNRGFYAVDSVEGQWNSGKEESPNLGHKPRYKEGYFPVPPTDSYQNLRSKMVSTMRAIGINAEIHHHEVATAGQAEIDMKYNTLVEIGDSILKYKYVTKNVAAAAGKTATFMPKPLFQDNGSGMHVHTSLWKEGKNLFFDKKGYALMSDTGLHFIGGVLKHARSLLGLCAPTTNSYRRLVPGFEAPVNLVFSQRNRSAAVRIPMYSEAPNQKRVEFRCPDPSCNPYLALTAILMAGLDGVMEKIEPPAPVDHDLYEMSAEDLAKIGSTPGSLDEAMEALEADHEFLLRGDVFTKDLIHMWLNYKREREVDYVRLRPHPAEFALYYDI